MSATQLEKNESKTDYLKRCTDARQAEGEDRRTAFSRCAANLADDQVSMVLSAPVQMIDSGKNEAKRSFLIAAKTGDPVVQWGWTTVIDIDGMRTENRMPVLREHARDRIVGHGQSYKDGDMLLVEGDFSTVTDDAKEVLDLADEGYPWQASIGVWAEEVSTIEAGVSAVVNGQEINGPADIWKRSFVREVSFVTLGLDPRTAAIAMAGDHSLIGKNDKEKESTMDIKEMKEKHPDVVKEIFGEAYDQGIADGIEKERGRVVEILDADADPAHTRTAIADGTDAGAAYKSFFEAEKAKRADGLIQLESEATPHQGVGHDGDQPNPEDGLSADKVVSMRAMALSKEKGVSYDEASKQVLREDRELSEKYRDLYTV